MRKVMLRSLPFWILLGCTVVGLTRAEPRIARVSFWSPVDKPGLVIRIHSNGKINAYGKPRFISGTNVLQVKIFYVALADPFQQDKPVEPIRSYQAELTDHHLTLSFTLNPNARVEANTYRDGDSEDILISLSYEDNDPKTPAVAATHIGRAPVEPGVDPTRGARERWKFDTVVIDAGHGGKDHGAVANGVREKDITLNVALRLGKYIRDSLGVRVVYTRRDDRFIELKQRGKTANREGGKLFISIHANAARNKAAEGTETFFLGMHKSNAARAVMERENSVVHLESDPDQYREYDEQTLILQTLANSAYMRKSEQLAGIIEKNFSQKVRLSSRGVKQAGFYVLWSASMPAVLVELGFVTNPREASFLKSEKGQDYLANAIFNSVKAFKKEYEKDLDLVVGQ